jgi:hypothetical protein
LTREIAGGQGNDVLKRLREHLREITSRRLPPSSRVTRTCSRDSAGP